MCWSDGVRFPTDPVENDLFGSSSSPKTSPNIVLRFVERRDRGRGLDVQQERPCWWAQATILSVIDYTIYREGADESPPVRRASTAGMHEIAGTVVPLDHGRAVGLRQRPSWPCSNGTSASLSQRRSALRGPDRMRHTCVREAVRVGSVFTLGIYNWGEVNG